MGHRWQFRRIRALFVGALLSSGCTSITDYVHNGFKVGPNFVEPAAPVSKGWIDSQDARIQPAPIENDAWWGVFHDPTLDVIIQKACAANLDLKTAAARVFEAQAQKNIAAGNLFPQTQTLNGDYAHAQISQNFNVVQEPGALGGGFPNTLDVWSTGFNMSWELDFWGRLRRGVIASENDVNGYVEAYRNALVTLLSQVATNYVQLRTYQQRIAYARHNVEIQTGSLHLAEERLKQGLGTSLDVDQAKSTLAQTEATIPPLVIGARQANDQLCVLLGQPASTLLDTFNEAPIPSASPEVAVGIPAELLTRRPDVRRARFQAAAQCQQIGIAEADFYPAIGVSGFLGYAADDIRHLFESPSFTAYILPNFSWKVLNYGRIQNNVRVQDARFQQQVLQYQSLVLTAGREVEDALIGFLQFQVQTKSLEESVQASERAVNVVLLQYKNGTVDFNRVYTVESQLVSLQDQLAAARGNVALSLISVYRALGGGWQTFDKSPCKPADRTETVISSLDGPK
jgi:NodT family efflux transporter outer membrane factor (OMF) lipoprotein